MDFITYSLRVNNKDSDKYYEEIGEFTDDILSKAKSDYYGIINEYHRFAKKAKDTSGESIEEHILEFLMIGVLWSTYIYRAKELSMIPKKVLIGLSYLRGKNTGLKKTIDWLKGIFITLFLVAKQHQRNHENVDYLKDLETLINWLKATGEYNEAVGRLCCWKEYFSKSTKENIAITISASTEFSQWFEASSITAIGYYTDKVEKYLTSDLENHRWKEDFIFCGRKRVEYHFNMVGAEILNRAFRKDFIKTTAKAVLLPSCIRLKDSKNCMAHLTDRGLVCKGCSGKCRVNQLTILGRRYNFDVYIIPHQSTAFTRVEHNCKNQLGIVGIACILNLLEGGWRARKLGMIPQCVLLDFCGCSNHWHRDGIITDININRLLMLLDKNIGDLNHNTIENR